MSISYKDAGVDIAAGEQAVREIKNLVKQTFSPNVLTEIGLFGGCFAFPVKDYRQPVLVASTDGVGTKLIIANLLNRHDTVGQCLVNHCVNDILTTGAHPLFFLDYIGTGQLKPATTTEIIRGISLACQANGCALIGGEMAEMPDIYQTKDYDLVGTIVGVVEKDQMLVGRVGKGDVLLGLPSTGLHTNGYSLARKVLLTKYSVTDYIPELNATIGDALLAIHRSYLNAIEPLLADPDLHALSHITGGGIIVNTSRVVPENLTLKINWQAWEWPPLFKFIQKTGEIDVEEMRRVFNLGIGMIIICAASAVDKFCQVLLKTGEKPVILGEIC
ncbi:MAG TPA: phosphoribosylformylglycinamidine cyclo-ligase [Candidatus Marinimicrobia bacterium]|nr:phosphoribosylformylglycinamidine cyclo-ligase [Candidatus Neomarinimicrobiota bacterium]HRS52317.1 phosphoribosylformylglycinamidine cyclo-ligase [Candidatus Neomarinimicrobiota bacterium]HRU92055.1 phosphoribosylformylglycinamidine cyclo-ligase [Candidatus Neomarinimicrobiota bacterium]